jgi:hypothetical protein
MASYYDYVLGFIPLALLSISATLLVAGWSLTAAVPTAASVSVLAIGHALFVNGPTDDTEVVAETVTAPPVNAD